MVGLNDHQGPIQLEQFYDSVIRQPEKMQKQRAMAQFAVSVLLAGSRLSNCMGGSEEHFWRTGNPVWAQLLY